MISDLLTQPAAISLAWMPPMANEEITGTVAYRAAAPFVVGQRGTSVPVGADALKGTSLPNAGLHGSGMAQVQAVPTAVADRSRITGDPGAAPRGRPVC